MKRLLVTGSRMWPTPIVVRKGLLAAYQHLGTGRIVLVHGGAVGVDTIAADFWLKHKLGPVEAHPAEWHKDGRYDRAAGHKRNKRMVDTRPDLCVAFIHNESAGATGCAAMALRARIPTKVFRA